MADDDAGTVDSNVAVFVQKRRIARLVAGGEELRVALVVEDSDADPGPVPSARDVSTALTLAMTFEDVAGAVTTRPAVFADFGGATGDGTDGAIMATDVSFLVPGTWEVRAHVLLADGTRFSTEAVLLRVLEDVEVEATLLPETILPVHRVAWWRELHTVAVGNPGRLGTWLDMWVSGELTAVSVAAAGGPSIVAADAGFGGKTSFTYDEIRDLEAGVAADWTFLHDGTGVTMWGDVRPDDAAEKDSLFGTAWAATQAGIRFEYDGPAGEVGLSIFNGTGTALHEVRFAHPVGTRARYAIDWCYDDPSGVDIRVYLNGSLVASVDTDYPGAPASGVPQDELHVGEDPSGTSQRFTGRLAELGFVSGCIAPELSAYLMAQP